MSRDYAEKVHQRFASPKVSAEQDSEQEQEGGRMMAPPPFQLFANPAEPPAAPVAPPASPNETGMPDQLKSGVEQLSGHDMSDVRVVRNSEKPAQLQAHAFAQGNEIHLGPGQEKHLPHEAWHVAQQKSGRVQATTQLKGMGVNDDIGLEREADEMGARALQDKADPKLPRKIAQLKTSDSHGPIQRAKDAEDMPLASQFTYSDIVSWNGKEGEHAGVHFVRNDKTMIMEAMEKMDNQGNMQMVILFNPNHLIDMSPEARYLAVLHELAHLHYKHPGNNHPDSMANEVQADDTALVNAITLYPLEAPNAVRGYAYFMQKMKDHGYLGGGSHPETAKRKDRINILLDEIMNNASLDIQVDSDNTPKFQMDQFLQQYGANLGIDQKDVYTIHSNLGSLSYISGKGTLFLREYLDFIAAFNPVKGLINNLRQTYHWNLSPLVVQNQIKDKLPY